MCPIDSVPFCSTLLSWQLEFQIQATLQPPLSKSWSAPQTTPILPRVSTMRRAPASNFESKYISCCPARKSEQGRRVWRVLPIPESSCDVTALAELPLQLFGHCKEGLPPARVIFLALLPIPILSKMSSCIFARSTEILLRFRDRGYLWRLWRDR